jgi:hypothetical protein
MKSVIVAALLLITTTAGVTAIFLPSTNSPNSGNSTALTSAIFNSTYTGSITFHYGPNSTVPEECSTLVNTVSNQGYEVETYVSSASAKTGSVMCIGIVVVNVSGPALIPGSGVNIQFNVTDSSGRVVTYSICYPHAPPQSPGDSSSPKPMPSMSCAVAWDTSSPADGVIPGAGTYQVTTAAQVPNSSASGYQTISSNSTLVLTN